MSIETLTAAYEAYKAARRAAEMPNGEFDVYLDGSFRAPTPEEYAGYQIVRYGSAGAALSAMQREGQRPGDMDSISRQAATTIVKAMKG